MIGFFLGADNGYANTKRQLDTQETLDLLPYPPLEFGFIVAV
jgi:hypothetical protein